LAEAETEYRRKFLVVVDETPECDRAVTFAAYRVRRTGGSVVLLSVIEPLQSQQWMGVDDVLRAEARESAEGMLDARLKRIAKVGPVRTETVIREGRVLEEIERLVREDSGIAILVLGASSSNEGPGPLVTTFAGRSGSAGLPILITIVPASMTDEQIIAVT
jgi:nucleotide-binding universal stress UspA family protein